MKRRLVPIAILLLALGGAYAAYAAYGSNGSRDVVIPKDALAPLDESYALLRSLHVHVLVAFLDKPTLNITSFQEPVVAQVWPPPGSRVGRGESVTLVAEVGSFEDIAVARSHPDYRVPNFVGRPASAAINWARRHELTWAIPKLPPLASTSQHELYAAYLVVAQQPKPGATLGQGHRTRSGGWMPTPLTLTVGSG
jgi:beta-lactam-binding protein with PASTA domain